MAGRVDPSRDLRLGLRALEGRLVDREQLVAAVADWASSPDRTLAEVLVARGAVAAPAAARLEEQLAAELGPSADGRPDDPDATRTVAFAVSSHDAQAEEVGGGRFRVLRPHARGGLGEVFLAFDRELNRTVALKELQAQPRARPGSARPGSSLEAEVTGRLEHPGIVPVYGLGRHRRRPAVLRDALHRGRDPPRRHRAVPPAEAAPGPRAAGRWRSGGCCGASSTPATPSPTPTAGASSTATSSPRTSCSAGSARRWSSTGASPRSLREPEGEDAEATAPGPADDPSMTRPGSVIGTPRYMSPEQAAGDLDRVGPASDVYSLGAILYCVLVGHGPFPDGDVRTVLDRVRRGIFPRPRRLRRAVDPALEAICLKAMALDPAGPPRLAARRWPRSSRPGWPTSATAASRSRRWARSRARWPGSASSGPTTCFGREAHDEGMLWLARALENVPADPPDLERVIRDEPGRLACRGEAAGTDRSATAARSTPSRSAPTGGRLATACGDGDGAALGRRHGLGRSRPR